MLNWARSTSRGWWDEWDDTVIETQDNQKTVCMYVCLSIRFQAFFESNEKNIENNTIPANKITQFAIFFIFMNYSRQFNELNIETNNLAAQPSRHETLKQCCLNVGPPSATLAQHSNNIVSTSRACWEALKVPIKTDCDAIGLVSGNLESQTFCRHTYVTHDLHRQVFLVAIIRWMSCHISSLAESPFTGFS